MAETQLTVAGRPYIVRCPDGEEANLARLAAIVDGKVREAGGATLTEVRALLFAALFLADEVGDLRREVAALRNQPAPPPPPDDRSEAQAITTLAQRIEKVAATLAARSISA